MKVSINWIRELVDLNISVDELANLIPLRIQGGTKEVTKDYIKLDIDGYNRADLLSLRGVAYEVAAITDSKISFKEPDESSYTWINQSLPKLGVEVENENLCPLYCLAKIENIKVEHSHDTWVKKLNDSGIRSVNNIADVTNLVMLEYGQPLHAFDASSIKGQVKVRTAKKEERITTLDEKRRELEPTDLLITDEEGPIALAGVMGGKDSEVTDSTTTILLEAAIFDPATNRKTAKRLSLQSEASKRFYTGLTSKRLFQALDVAIRMYQHLGGKLTALTIIGQSQDQLKKIPLTYEKVVNFIGVDLSNKQIEKYLNKLQFHLEVVDGNWVVTPPYFRLDIEIEEDLIEEVARMYGYENVPAKKLSGEPQKKTDQRLYELISKLKNQLVNQGLTEVQTYSFFSTAVLENCKLDKNQLVKIANPMSAETEYLRDHIWPNLVEVVGKNLKQGFTDIAIFEIGKVYIPVGGNPPKEVYKLAIALMNGSDNPIRELYQIYQGVNPSHTRGVLALHRLFHPTRSVTINYQDTAIGVMAEIHPRVLHGLGIDQRVAIVEVDLEPLLK